MDNPWDRQAGEPALWYNRFTVYRRMGPERTLLGAWRKATEAESGGIRRGAKLPGAWQRQYERWTWKARAEAFDRHKEAAAERKWNQRYDQQRETEWGLSQDLIAKAKQMMSMPLVKTNRTVEEDGRTIITEVETARWAFRDAAGFIDTASKLARLAVGKPTGETKITIDVDDLGDLREMTDEQLSAIYRNLAALVNAASHPRDVGDGAPAANGDEPPELGDPAPA